jgi:hypothetical protein
MPLDAESAANIDPFFTAIKSLNELDTKEIRNVVGGLLQRSARDSYFTLNYHRAIINIEFLLTVKDMKQFQVIVSLARMLMETAVEMWLIRKDANAAEKIRLIVELEKLKTAKKILAFKAEHPNAKTGDTLPLEQFVRAGELRILQEKQQMWPNVNRVTHWSLVSLEQRCRDLGQEFDELYQVHYSELSWYVHSGVTGVANVQGETLSQLCGVAFQIIVKCYGLILESVINEFKIYHADDKLKDKITLARMLPFTNTPGEAEALARALGL